MIHLNTFKHMKGPRWDQVPESHRRFPYYASPKVDGFRASVLGGKLMTSGLVPFRNEWTQSRFSHRVFEGFDGEIVVGEPNEGNVYTRTSSGVTRIAGKPDVKLLVFDLIPTTSDECVLTWQQRQEILDHRIRKLGMCSVELWHHELVKDNMHLTELEERWVADGFEGAILRDPAAVYTFGRCKPKEAGLIKLKRYLDSEALVLEEYQMKSNQNDEVVDEITGRKKRSSAKSGMVPKDMVGGLRCRDLTTGVEFNLGSGLNDELRTGDSLVGKVITYKYQPVGVKNKPRQPIFKSIRDCSDLPVELQGNLF